MTLKSRLLACAAASFASGCITINIYFPAAAAEKAADKIIDQIWQLQTKPAAEAPKEKSQ
jgi:hypothetical protein